MWWIPWKVLKDCEVFTPWPWSKQSPMLNIRGKQTVGAAKAPWIIQGQLYLLQTFFPSITPSTEPSTDPIRLVTPVTPTFSGCHSCLKAWSSSSLYSTQVFHTPCKFSFQSLPSLCWQDPPYQIKVNYCEAASFSALYDTGMVSN